MDLMPHRALRLAAFGLLTLFALVISNSQLVQHGITRAHADGAEEFSCPALNTINTDCVAESATAPTPNAPAKVYSGIPTAVYNLTDGIHADGDPIPADADAGVGLVGYCVGVQFEGHAPIPGSANNGFTVTNGSVISSDFFDNGSTTTTDDVYCVVVVAQRITNQLPRPNMVVNWTYLDGALPITATLAVEVVTVQLKGTDGPVGSVVHVCTSGWDPTFLTGAAANTPPTLPVVFDQVVAGDFATIPTGPTILGVVRSGPEWCVNLVSPTTFTDLGVTLDFWAIYQPLISTDDIPIHPPYHDLETGTVNITPATTPELRHIVGGQVSPLQTSNPLVIGSQHTVCILPSVATDTLNASDIVFVNNGETTVTGLFVFTTTGAPSDPGGVPLGTKCFTWTSTGPGLQFVSAKITMSTLNPDNSTGHPVDAYATWDADGDGNGDPSHPGGTLVTPWNVIDTTAITLGGGLPDDENTVTGTKVPLHLQFTALDGRFDGSISLTEWVLGSRPDPYPATNEPTDGVPLTITIAGTCGYFGDTVGTKVLTGPDVVTLDGRYSFKVNVLHDPGCSGSQIIHVEIKAHYPGAIIGGGSDIELETGDIETSVSLPVSSPIVVWVGESALISYGFGGSCTDGTGVRFTRSTGTTGSFSPGTINPAEIFGDSAQTTTSACSADIRFESEDPGEFDIVAELDGNAYSKTLFPVIVLAFEDVTLQVNGDPATSTQTVSERGTLTTTVRGWFPGADPSGRPAVTRNGNSFPKDRWILPDDWSLLKGGDQRIGWPGTAAMPPALITYFIANEGTVNSFKGTHTGASGYFMEHEGDEFSFNVNPITGASSVLGSPGVPRILSDFTGPDGTSVIDTYGDFNLSYEGCAVNAPTGNPNCKPDDVAGHATYYALADYPEWRGKWPPLRTNDTSTTFTWQGYKQLTYEDSTDPTVKYVVAHLKDRDGFCDAIGFHNTLGVPLDFQIDSGSGIIIDAKDDPATITDSRRFAITTSFDTADDEGNPINLDIVRTVITPDECQAWIKITNSLDAPANVVVTFPPPPSPVPGNLVISSYVCTGNDPHIVLKNVGTSPLSLAGFALRTNAGATIVTPEAHYGLLGHLDPGESTTIYQYQFGGLAGASTYARIAWEETTVSIADCNGNIVTPPTPTFVADGEGSIVLDIIVPFSKVQTVQLNAGWNLITTGSSPAIKITDAAGTKIDGVGAVYLWDPENETWLSYFPDGAPEDNTIDSFEPNHAYWVFAKEPFTLQVPK
jgi:hypothetical protein